MDFDATGKVTLDHIYTQTDPRAYFNTLSELDYCIPQLAKPYFAKLIHEYREARGVRVPTILDIGCSYGINAALLKCEATIDELNEHYGEDNVQNLSREDLIARDQELVRTRDHAQDLRFVGLDNSEPALSYAVSCGFLDAAVHADLEQHELTDPQREQVANVDLVISTGCIGYVSEKTISRISAAQRGERKPWMAHLVLRMFPFDPIAEILAGQGYETVRVDGLFRQRRFASAEEQSLVLDTLSDAGVDPRGLEADGWLYAGLYISRPRDVRALAAHPR